MKNQWRIWKILIKKEIRRVLPLFLEGYESGLYCCVYHDFPLVAIVWKVIQALLAEPEDIKNMKRIRGVGLCITCFNQSVST